MKRAVPQNNLSVKTALEAYEHIELTGEEYMTAILQAKQKKERLLQYQEQQERAERNRRALTSDMWDYDVTRVFMLQRAQNIFEGKFNVDEKNRVVFDLLCRYFSDDREFLSTAEAIGVSNPSLQKGILLAGTFGTGKTWIMKLFQRNKKACYLLKNAKQIAGEFQEDGVEAVTTYQNKIKNSVNDATLFYQPYCGLCIDDLGTEDIKNNFGNKANVIGDLIEMRYAKGNAGPFLHATTNMDAQGIKEFYGGRVVSRMREVFNIIELSGNDRRK